MAKKKLVTTGDRGKDDIVKCIIELALRSEELGHKSLHRMLFTIAGSCFDQSEDVLAAILAEYAAMRLQLRKDQDNENKKNNQDNESKEE